MKKMPGDIIILHMCTINNNYMIYNYWDTIEWGELGWFSEKVEFSKKKYLGCVLRIYVENPFWAVTLRCQMQQFAMKSWFWVF